MGALSTPQASMGFSPPCYADGAGGSPLAGFGYRCACKSRWCLYLRAPALGVWLAD